MAITIRMAGVASATVDFVPRDVILLQRWINIVLLLLFKPLIINSAYLTGPRNLIYFILMLYFHLRQCITALN
jgi:hypothetical protein